MRLVLAERNVREEVFAAVLLLRKGNQACERWEAILYRGEGAAKSLMRCSLVWTFRFRRVSKHINLMRICEADHGVHLRWCGAGEG